MLSGGLQRTVAGIALIFYILMKASNALLGLLIISLALFGKATEIILSVMSLLPDVDSYGSSYHEKLVFLLIDLLK